MNIRTLTPRRRGWVVAASVVAALVSVACVAVISYYISSEVQQRVFIFSHFFGYFTVHMGILFAVTYLTYAAYRPWRGLGCPQYSVLMSLLEISRYCLAVYGVVILGVFWFILSKPSEWDFFNGWVVIHLVMPVVAIVCWIILPKSPALPRRYLLVPSGCMLLYAGVSYLVGWLSRDHWFPYFFLDFVRNGWYVVASYAVDILGALMCISIVMLVASRSKRRL